MSANKCAIVIAVNVIIENLFYIYLYPAYQALFDISIFKFTKLNNYPLQLITLNVVGIFSGPAYNAVTVNRMCVKNFQQENSNETFHVHDIYKA